MGEISESQCAYFLSTEGLFRFNIPDFDRVGKHEIEIECVFYSPEFVIPSYMGLFCHCHHVYMFGGIYPLVGFSRRVYMFDPTKSQQLPLSDDACLDKPDESRCNFEPVVLPYEIQAEDRVYFLSLDDPWGLRKDTLCFQAFDLTKNCFETHPSPPYKVRNDTYCPVGDFIVGCFIYLFFMVPESVRAFTFNTRSSEWKEREEMVTHFDENKIPIPHLHHGDIGLSDEFEDNTRILLAFHAGMPIAYRVQLGAEGSLSPKSYRVMDEVYFKYCDASPLDEWSRLLDIGGGRFCAIYQAEDVSLLIYVFKIDFALEHSIQISTINQAKPSSSEILCSKRLWEPIPFFGHCSRICAVCLANPLHKRKRKRGDKSPEEKNRLSEMKSDKEAPYACLMQTTKIQTNDDVNIYI